MKKFVFITVLLAQAIAWSDKDRGGGDSAKITQASFELLLRDGGLKKAMLNYLQTMSIEKIEDQNIKEIFDKISNALAKDIQVADNYEISTECKDSLGQSVIASTGIGDVGGKICFNVKAIAEKYADLSEEQAMIRLGALAFHEHIHHFQNRTASLESNEAEANLASGYVMMTARLMQLPLLAWSIPSKKTVYDYKTGEVKLKKGDVVFLAVSPWPGELDRLYEHTVQTVWTNRKGQRRYILSNGVEVAPEQLFVKTPGLCVQKEEKIACIGDKIIKAWINAPAEEKSIIAISVGRRGVLSKEMKLVMPHGDDIIDENIDYILFAEK